jgi:hemoglobin
MKTDIIHRNDIEKLVNAFYEKIKINPNIGFFFSDVVKVDWNQHLPIMYDFWENIVFHTDNFSGNPMAKHRNVNQIHAIKKEHFKVWEELFINTVDELFEGKNAELIKNKAISISCILQIKIIN